jgi:hypothetical protein
MEQIAVEERQHKPQEQDADAAEFSYSVD